MFQLSRSQLTLTFIALMLLRIVVGFHFFKEGTNKLKYGFESKYFFAAAKGPVAPLFKSMLDDPDGKVKLCVEDNPDSQYGFELNPEFTEIIWDNFIDETTSYYGLGSPDLIEKISKRRQDLADQINAARESGDTAVDTVALERQRELDERNIFAIREQPRRAEEIFQDHVEQLKYFLTENRTELVSHYGTSNRLDGFQRDGDNRKKVALQVESLRGQVDTIRSDRQKQLNGWTSEVVGMWDSLEDQINSLAVDVQAKRPRFPIHRPFDQENSKLKVINQVIPWFDTIIGVLLIIGLFSRLASGAAGLFLLSVIATQPPFIPGADPTYFYFIEMMACFVIFATGAGRMGGLDFFFSPTPKSPEPTPQQVG